MKNFSRFFLSAVVLVQFAVAETSQSGGTWFFSVPTKDVEKVRGMTKDPKDGRDVYLVGRTLRETPGVEVISHWWNWPEWRDKALALETCRFSGRKGNFDFDTQKDALLNYQLKAAGGVALLSLGLECIGSLNPEGRDYMRFTSDSGLVPVLEGQWRKLRICQRADGVSRSWKMSHEKKASIAKDAEISQSALNLMIAGKRNDGVLSMDIRMNRLEGDLSAALLTEDLSLEVVTHGWNFMPLKSGDVNVLLYREVKP